MLAALIANNQNVVPQPTKLPTVHIDRGGGGQSWPRYEIVDIVAAIAAFPEISGEHPVARAVRRHRWIGEALPGIKEARERREAAAFLAGATLADAAAEERHTAADAATEARHTAQDQLKIEQLVQIIDSVRGEPMAIAVQPAQPRQLERGEHRSTDGGIGLFVGGLVVGGLLVGIALSKRRRSLTS
jgi:hypothetical protein